MAVTSLGSDEVCSPIAAEEVVITLTGEEISDTTVRVEVVKYCSEEVGETAKEDEVASCGDGEDDEAKVVSTIGDEDWM